MSNKAARTLLCKPARALLLKVHTLLHKAARALLYKPVRTLLHKVQTLLHKAARALLYKLVRTLLHKVQTLPHKVRALLHKVQTLLHKVRALFHKSMKNERIVPVICSIVLTVAAWYAASYAVASSFVLPYPHEVVLRLASLCKTRLFYAMLGETVLRTVWAFALSVVLSLVLGILTGASAFFSRFFRFPLSLIKATPVVSFILLASFWFASGTVPVFVSVLMTLPVMTSAVASGVRGTDKKLIAMANVYGFTRVQKLRYVYIPSMKPYFFGGVLSALGLTWKVVVAGEILTLPKRSVGSALQTAKVHLETVDVFAWTLAVVALSFACELLFIRYGQKTQMSKRGCRLKRGIRFCGKGKGRGESETGSEYNVNGEQKTGAEFSARDREPKETETHSTRGQNCQSAKENTYRGLGSQCAEPNRLNTANKEAACPSAAPATQTAAPAVSEFAVRKIFTAPSGESAPCGVTVQHLFVTRGSKELYRDFSLGFTANTVTALLAPSGAGKTTLLDCIAGLLTPNGGSVYATRGDSPSAPQPVHGARACRVSYLFQEPRLLPWCTLIKNCMLPLESFMPQNECEKAARFFLARVGLQNRAESYPEELSGGEKQRAALARAFAYDAPVLLMDEAFQSQDIGLKQQLIDLLRTLNGEKPRTTVLVTHDIREALALADRVVVLKSGAHDSVLSTRLDVMVKEQNPVHVRDEILRILA